jgi:hypothetical protein
MPHVVPRASPFDTIRRANLDGSGVNNSFVTGVNGPCAVAVDGAHIYWSTDGGSGLIGQANLDGSGVNQSFISVTGAFMCGVAVDALLPTAITIMPFSSSILYGQEATFTASTAATPSGSPIIPTGTIQFKINQLDDGTARPERTGRHRWRQHAYPR